jgi:hypothetical protein
MLIGGKRSVSEACFIIKIQFAANTTFERKKKFYRSRKDRFFIEITEKFGRDLPDNIEYLIKN